MDPYNGNDKETNLEETTVESNAQNVTRLSRSPVFSIMSQSCLSSVREMTLNQLVEETA